MWPKNVTMDILFENILNWSRDVIERTSWSTIADFSNMIGWDDFLESVDDFFFVLKRIGSNFFVEN